MRSTKEDFLFAAPPRGWLAFIGKDRAPFRLGETRGVSTTAGEER